MVQSQVVRHRQQKNCEEVEETGFLRCRETLAAELASVGYRRAAQLENRSVVPRL